MAGSLPKVLIADDDKIMRLKLRRFIEKTIGAEVITAADGEEAWEEFNNNDIYFVISDWLMPRCDGPDLCRRIREQQREIYTYFILVTGKTDKDDLVEGMASGADDYITKPYDAAELESRIRAGFRIVSLQLELADKKAKLEQAIKLTNEALDAASKTQRRMLPRAEEIESLANEADLWVNYRYNACESIGGDVLGLVRPGSGQVVLFLCDVSGHGVAASLAAVSLHSYLRAVLQSNTDLVAAAKKANQYCCDEFPEGTYATAVLMLIDTNNNTVRLIVAGHPPVLLVDPDTDDVKLFEATIPPFGLIDDDPLPEDCIELTWQAGQRLIVYTDGVVETRNENGDFFDTDLLVECIIRNRAIPLALLPDVITAKLVDWRGTEVAADDDITILAIGLGK